MVSQQRALTLPPEEWEQASEGSIPDWRENLRNVDITAHLKMLGDVLFQGIDVKLGIRGKIGR